MFREIKTQSFFKKNAIKYKNNQLKIINDCLHFMDQSDC